MLIVRIPAATILAMFVSPGSGWATPSVGRLADDDTAITIEAGTVAPHLTSLTALKARNGRGAGDATTWVNQREESLPATVEINGATKTLAWHLDTAASRFGADVVSLRYLCDAPRLTLTWLWRKRAHAGPLEHTISIENRSDQEIWLPLLPSFRFAWKVAGSRLLQRFWVEKGADAPSNQGTHRDPLLPGDHWFGASSTYARPIAGQPREMIPYLWVGDTAEEAADGGNGWYVGIEFSGRTRITLQRAGDAVSGEVGLNPDAGPYRTRLPPGGGFATPTIFLGAARGGPDAAGNGLRRWIRNALGNPRALVDPHYPLMVNNSWGSGMAVDETLAKRMILESRRLGLEMFHLDAGWFRGVGDWHADPAKFPRGVGAVADFAHGQGLKFGLWVDWTQAGVSTEPGARNVYEQPTRDWLIADPPPDWKHTEEFKGVTMDIGVPAAREWAYAELDRIVTENHLDMLEHDGYLVAQGSSRTDHPAAPPDPATLRQYQDSGYLWVDGSNSTDVSDHATRAYYDIYERLRRKHPDLLLELCNDGGRMVDFGSAAHGDYFSITDIYDPLSNRRAFFDASYVLPPAMLESYVEKWPTPSLDAFRYMLRSGMMGWFSLMLDTSQWTAEQHAAAVAEFALYKRALRPLIREGDLYHVAPRPDGVHWDGIEYYSKQSARGVLFAFRGSIADESAHRYRLDGLDPHRSYRVTFNDGRGPEGGAVKGAQLMHDGLEVRLAAPLSSELVFFAAQ